MDMRVVSRFHLRTFELRVLSIESFDIGWLAITIGLDNSDAFCSVRLMALQKPLVFKALHV